MVAEIIELMKKYKKPLIYTGLIIVLAYSFISFFSQYSLLNVSIIHSPATTELTVYTSSDSETKEIGKPGLHIIPRNVKSVIAQAGRNIRTQSQVTIPWYGYIAKEIELKADKNADKIAYKSLLDRPCGAYSERLNRLSQYSCSNSNSFVYYNTPSKGDWSIETISNNILYPNYSPVSYMGGLLGVAYVRGSDSEPPSNLVSVSDIGESNYLKEPEGIDLNNITQAGIFTDKNDQTNNHFALVTIDGTIYLATPKSKTDVDYVKIAPPEGYSPDTQQTVCDVNGDFATCYRGLSPNLGDGVIDYSSVQSSITTLNFTNSSTETVDVNKLLTLDAIAVTNDGLIYGKIHKKLLFFEKKGAQYQAVELSQNIDGIAAGDKLTFLQDGGVFAVDPSSRNLYQIFYSKNIQPKQLFSASGKVFIIGKVPGDKSASYAWTLNNEDNNNNGNRLIDKLPSFPSSIEYGDTDFVGNIINIKVLTDRSSTAQGIRDTKQSTLDYLSSIGVDTNQLQLSN